MRLPSFIRRLFGVETVAVIPTAPQHAPTPHRSSYTEAQLREYYGRTDVHLIHLDDRAGYEVRIGRKRFEVSYVPLAWARSRDDIRAAMSGAKELEDLDGR